LSSIILVALNSARQKGIQAAALEFATANYHAFGADAVAIYNFNDATNIGTDSANNNTLTTCSSVTQNSKTPGTSGSSAYFNGSSATCNGTITSSIPSLTNKGSISFWIYPTSVVSGGANYISNITGNNGWIALCSNSTSNVIAVNNGTTDICTGGVIGTQNIPLNTWTQVFISWNSSAPSGQKTVIYINGKLDSPGSSNQPSPNWATGSTLYLGGYGSYGFIGYLDDFSIYTQSIQ
jgi:hypothetical protein